MKYNPVSLRHLQANLPWSKKYTTEFIASATENPFRIHTHDVLHVMKSLGQVAAECERVDHGEEPKLNREQFADRLADLVICALHMANTTSTDLTDAVVQKIQERNNVTLPIEHFQPVTFFDPSYGGCICNLGTASGAFTGVHSTVCQQVREFARANFNQD